MYSTYIFDLYGTLIDIHTDEESPELWERLSYHFRYSGISIEAGELEQEFHANIQRQMSAPRVACEHPDFDMEETFRTIAERRSVTPTAGWTEETVRWFRQLSIRRLALYDGVEETLRSLKAQGKRVYLLSNGQRIFVEAELRVLGIDGYFDGIAISSNAGISKPDPLFYDYLVSTFGADLSSAVMIGNDSRTDIEGARRAGIDGCYIHSNSSPDVQEVDCKFQIWDGDFNRVLELVG
ncbi:HAD-superfamily hydrolase, subfamily IA, variant 1 [Paenibacillus curdlanolyticus YK9]|uniref:HAD-superfamily hydrolase, subfamily IA, variant 1 n=1 Tax=Paenibacillus curdlanolyticus YK9 TaxID=717606 RepID=E0I9R4_9BACL|nr:HAD family hydrolase [Paenibacillus curdlanolyticus]EFM11148.1 HAD-superfamily hydrolase, subfamily IA, variant 1 [Paenibacillus curdlanolyticus YK9]